MAISGLSVIDLQRRGRRVEVVLADEDRRRTLHGGEVQRLVKAAMIGGAVAEEGDADVVAPLLAGAHADADGMADAGGDDAVGAEQADRAVVEMHRAAAAAADAVGLAEQLGHHTSGIGALGQRVAVTAMRGGHPVGRPQMRADADAGRLLADIEMQKAGRLALAAGDLGDAFEAAQQHHPLEQIEQDLPVGQIRRTLELFACARRRNCHQSLPGSVWRRATMSRRRACWSLASAHNRL